MSLVVIELVGPVGEVAVEVNLLGGPEGGHVLLVHLPHVVVLDGEEDKPVWVVPQDWLVGVVFLVKGGDHLGSLSKGWEGVIGLEGFLEVGVGGHFFVFVNTKVPRLNNSTISKFRRIYII